MKLSARVSKFLVALLSLILTFSGVIGPVQATGFPPNNGHYVCTTGEQDYDDEPNTYLILSGVVMENNCPGAVVIAEGVTGIDEAAFYNAALTSITFPASVATIGIEAFAGATQLRTVSFAQGSQLITIGDYAFDGALALSSITIPAGVTTIGDGAFYNADALTSITIPASVSTIGVGAFFAEDQLTSITVDSGNTAFASIDGVLFNAATTTLIHYPSARSEAAYSIPTGVTTIAEGAFYNSDNLTSINIPASVTTIWDWAFEDTDRILDFNFWNNAPTTISEYAFGGISESATVHIKENATGFGVTGSTWNGLVVEADLVGDGSYVCTTGERRAEEDTSPAYAITNGIVSAGEGCAGEVVIRDGAVWIETGAFYGAGLESVSIPKSVTSIGIWAFCETTATSINVDLDNIYFASDNGVLFTKDWSTLIAYPSGSYLANYSVPTSVMTISDSAFYKSLYLETLNIPDSVTDIQAYAFANSPELESVTFADQSPITKVRTETFAVLPKLSSITIPEGVTSIEDSAFYNSTSLTDVNFLGDAPTVVAGAFTGTFSGAKAYTKASATGFGDTGDLWNGLLVEANLVVDGYYACASGLPSTSSDVSLAYRVTNKVVLSGTGCTGSVVIPAGVKEIGGYAFNSSGITSISLPAGLKKIGNGAFDSATSLSSITIPASLQSLGQFAFYYAQNLEAVSFAEGSQLTSIGNSAFSRIPGLTSITIPASVTTIGISAFAVSAALMEVNFLGNAPTVGLNVFSQVASGAQAKISSSATGFGTGTTWNGLVIDRAASVSAPVTNSPTTSSPVTNSPTTNTPVANTPTTSTPDTTTPETTVPTTFTVTSYEVKFAAGSSVITQDHKTAFKKIVSKSGKMATFTVIGVAAKVLGVSDSLAKVMAKARAEKIRAYFMNLGVKKSAISIKVKIVNSGVAPKTNILAKQAKP